MTHPFRRLDDQTLVHGQISVADIDLARAAGITGIINNRPDGEEPDQIPGAVLQAAALAVGMSYVAAPSYGMPDDAVVNAVADALVARAAHDQTLMFCKSGTRSTVAWAMVQRRRGLDVENIRGSAAEAGYDLSRLPL